MNKETGEERRSVAQGSMTIKGQHWALVYQKFYSDAGGSKGRISKLRNWALIAIFPIAIYSLYIRGSS